MSKRRERILLAIEELMCLGDPADLDAALSAIEPIRGEGDLYRITEKLVRAGNTERAIQVLEAAKAAIKETANLRRLGAMLLILLVAVAVGIGVVAVVS